MKIIEALKELPVLEKRIEKNNVLIQQYSSYGSHVGPAFASQEDQTKEVQSLLQANNDLITRSLKMRRVLNLTNATVVVGIGEGQGGKILTITEWIAYRNKMGKLLLATYQHLNINQGSVDVKGRPANLATEGVSVQIVRCFDEKYKNTQIESIQNTLDLIDAALEKVNATMDLVEEI